MVVVVMVMVVLLLMVVMVMMVIVVGMAVVVVVVIVVVVVVVVVVVIIVAAVVVSVIFVLRQTCVYVCACTVGQVVHTLPEGEIVWGVASLADEIYVLRPKGQDDIEVYDAATYHLQRCLTVPNSRGFADMTVCERYRCLYVVDPIAMCIHRLGAHGEMHAQWPVGDKPYGISVHRTHNVLVTCSSVRRIKEFSPRGDLLRELTVPEYVVNPWHALQLANGHFVVCHGEADDPANRVCTTTADGRRVVHSHGGQPGSDVGRYHVPRHLAVDNNDFVFVVDVNNRRVTLLSPTLDYVCQVVSRDKLKWRPRRLHLDAQRRRLYVADNEWKEGGLSAGRIVVFSI